MDSDDEMIDVFFCHCFPNYNLKLFMIIHFWVFACVYVKIDVIH